ncbi:unnamed protein product, partial [marine sediment metagenome]
EKGGDHSQAVARLGNCNGCLADMDNIAFLYDLIAHRLQAKYG